MGTLYQAPSEPAIQDLKVTFQDSTLIFPSQETENKSIFLSNIDQVLNFHVQTLHFFPPNPDFPPETVVTRLRNALQKVMVAYDFLAGRLKLNHQTGRLEIECNGSGAGFVVATTEFSLHEIGDLVYPNPAFMQLIVQGLQKFDDEPLCVLQVTSFKCGGFAMGLSTNHILFDGLSFKFFLENLASQAFDDKPISIMPCHDRQLLAARSPPQVTFPHPELLKLKLPIGEEKNLPVFDCKQEDLDFKIFSLSPDNINYLKEKAKAEGTNPTTKITGFNVVTAHVWRCKALSCDIENNRERESMVLYSVDIRSRVKPPLPMSYCGNAVLSAYASAKCAELEDVPFFKIVEMVSAGAARMTDEYAKSAIDWGEVYKGFPNGEFLISSWWRLGFDEVVYPWGTPRYSCPLVYHRKDIILLFPEIGGAKSNGVNILVALPHKEMEKFQSLFHKYLV
ncbi:Omega-hydroxypalmitate O-feruloyl transferase [Handroanthus impetiginosus]|uniref:Omega-hydroxypalmitate O-feruloyl transferase n=1 Tax=Handroanthus impetiginosus TaxID=429701 RepID=A0A2G9I0S4_9LAMI|nr:Omega-hydroxypalmitate O-feruloyl transferase [Handroanthus impetiginosus]